MNKNFNFQAGKTPLIILVISSLFLIIVLVLVNFNKTSVSNVSTIRKPLPFSSAPSSLPTDGSSQVDSSPSAPQDGLDCLEESESGCDDSEDVPIDPEDLLGPD